MNLEQPHPTAKPNVPVIAALCAVALAAAIGVTALLVRPDTPQPVALEVGFPSATYEACQKLVTAKINKPETAVFPSVEESKAQTATDPTGGAWRGVVKSANAYGELVEKRFTCAFDSASGKVSIAF
jgi:hypothetical protein